MTEKQPPQNSGTTPTQPTTPTTPITPATTTNKIPDFGLRILVKDSDPFRNGDITKVKNGK